LIGVLGRRFLKEYQRRAPQQTVKEKSIFKPEKLAHKSNNAVTEAMGFETLSQDFKRTDQSRAFPARIHAGSSYRGPCNMNTRRWLRTNEAVMHQYRNAASAKNDSEL
jgi:hypothetical protein